MSDTDRHPIETAPRRHTARWSESVSRRLRTVTLVTALFASAGAAACSDFHMSTRDLDISPRPATPGDMVVARFILSLVPVQRHTISVFIDDDEFLRVTSDDRPEIPVVVVLGDAADLIARYGAGTHAAHVEVRAHEDNETARTASVILELEQTASSRSREAP